MSAGNFDAISALMKFGLFYQLACSADQSPVQRYRDTLEQAVYAEALGFESIWPGEWHFVPGFSILPSPLLLLAAVAERTKSLRLGIAVIPLPLYHPVRLAEEIATLDILSNGRVEFGIGRGLDDKQLIGFGIPQAETHERLREGLEIVRKAWTEARFSYRGRFFNIEDLSVVPKPVQQPHPPIRVAANSPGTFELMGRLGYPIFAASHIIPYTRIKELLALYHQAHAAAGHQSNDPDDFTLLSPLYVGESPAQIRQDLEQSLIYWRNTLKLLRTPVSITDIIRNWRPYAESWVELALKVAPHRVAVPLRAVIERAHRMNYERMNKTMAIFDTPERCVDRLACLQEDFKMGRMICWFNLGGQVPHLRVMRSMELFAERVMPHFQSRSERDARLRGPSLAADLYGARPARAGAG